MIATILSQIGVPLLSNLLGEVLEKINSPTAQIASKALLEVDEAIKKGDLTLDDITEANRHTEKMAEIKLLNHARTTEEINKTIRSEIASKDMYIARMRPTFGYVMAVTWAVQMLAVAYVIIFDTERSGVVLSAVSSLSAMWAVGLSVLGVYVYKRSEDKKNRSVVDF